MRVSRQNLEQERQKDGSDTGVSGSNPHQSFRLPGIQWLKPRRDSGSRSRPAHPVPCSGDWRIQAPLIGDQTGNRFPSEALSGSGPPDIAMVEPAHARQTYNFTVTCFPSLDRPLVRRVFPQSIMNPILMIVAQVLTNQSSQVAFVDHDHLIEQFPPATPHPSFRHPILPRTLIGCADQFATQRSEDFAGLSLIFPVSIQDQVAR